MQFKTYTRSSGSMLGHIWATTVDELCIIVIVLYVFLCLCGQRDLTVCVYVCMFVRRMRCVWQHVCTDHPALLVTA